MLVYTDMVQWIKVVALYVVSVMWVVVVAPVVVVLFVVIATVVNVVVVVHRSRYCRSVVVVVESALSVPVKAQVVLSRFGLLRRDWRPSECG